MRSSNLFAFTLVLVPFATLAHADVIAGDPAHPDPGTGLCVPFACFYQGEYQQVYSSSLFSGPFDITGLQFFDSIFAPTGRASGSEVISLSTTSANWNTLSSTFSANVGPTATQVFNGTIGAARPFPGTLVLPFSTPFLYDPSKGNLLVDIQANIVVGGAVLYDTTGFGQPNNFEGVAYMGPAGVVVQSGYGLITDFQGAPVSSSSPEPSSILLLTSAVGGLVYFARGRRRRNA
ncbi:MAG: hypothetical protein JO307_04870 [Bryobacterales bacterium]|nr:hypothetical protein [Bryobacterales bacterium]MBV9400494.1 hypothetical protein [Bryobacterales bacterium]